MNISSSKSDDDVERKVSVSQLFGKFKMEPPPPQPKILRAPVRSTSLITSPIIDKPASLVSIRFFSADNSPVEPNALLKPTEEEHRRSSEDSPVEVKKRKKRGRPRTRSLGLSPKRMPSPPKAMDQQKMLNISAIMASLPRILPRQPSQPVVPQPPTTYSSTFPYLQTGQPNTMHQAQLMHQRQQPQNQDNLMPMKTTNADNASPELDVLRLISQAVDIRHDTKVIPTLETREKVVNTIRARAQRKASEEAATQKAPSSGQIRRLLPKPSSVSGSSINQSPVPIPRHYR